MIGPEGIPNAPLSMDDMADALRKAGIDTSALERGLLEASASVKEAARQAVVAPLTATAAAIAAATRGCFLPTDLAAGTDPSAVSTSDIEALLARSDVITTGSQRAWQLRPDARRDILEQAAAHGVLADNIANRVGALDERDGEGPLLRRVLAGDTPDVARLSIDDLGKLYTVSGWLGDTTLATVPDRQELRRVIAQREILDPFRMLVGRSVESGSDGSKDRVVGRVAEMEKLRAYVGVREPEQLKYYATRALGSLWSTVTFSDDASEPLLIKGIGGMGKSTLIAKFVLDHALIPDIDLPFVYLDFDRAALAPRQPMQLLIEIATQLGIQFPGMEPALAELRRHLRNSIDLQAKNPDRREAERQTRSELTSFCNMLRTAVEAFNTQRAPVVMLLDTFEVVQYDQAAVDGVNALIAALRKPAQKAWENLRIVVAGRGDLADVKTSKDPVELLQLSIDATETLIAHRSESEGLGLTAAQVKALAPALRNSPLDVIVVTNWLRDRKPEERAALAASLVEDVDRGQSSAQHANAASRGNRELAARRITGILIKRMIRHINDPEVRELADPGLVVRAVTPEVVRDVMAPACGLASADKPLAPGAERVLWERLRAERWLVTQQGEVLMHRPEVRRAMLDLMRENDKEAFDRTNELALATFMQRAADDDVSRAEAVYHLLLSREPRIEEAEKLWTPSISTRVAASVDDLAPLAGGYVEAKLGRSVAIDTLMAMPHAVSDPLVLANGALYMEDLGPAGVLRLLDASPELRRNPACEGLRCEALYRGGMWSGLADVVHANDPAQRFTEAVRPPRPGKPGLDASALTALRFLLRWGTRDEAGRRPWQRPLQSLAGVESMIVLPLQVPALCWDYATFVACDGLRGEVIDPTSRSAVLHAVAELARRSDPLPSEAAGSDALRVLSFFEAEGDRPILRRVDFASHFATVSGREILALGALISLGDVKRAGTPANASAYMEASARGHGLLQSVGSVSERTVRADIVFTREFSSVVRAIAESGDEATSRAILRILALKHPDWTQPLGNALTQAFDGTVSRKLGWWSSIDKYLGSGEQPRSDRETTDGREILSLADEASSLPEAVDAYTKLLAQNATPAAREFVRLAAAFIDWVTMLQRRTDDHRADAA